MQYDPGFERLRVDPAQLNRAFRTGRILLSIGLIVVLLLSLVSPYTDFLWFSHDARHPEVFELSYGTRGLLLLVAFFLTWIVIYWNVRKAFKVSLIFLSSPQGAGQAMLSNAIDWITRRGAILVMLAAPILAFLLATGFSAEWNTFLLAQNAQHFGVKDPLYGLDLGYFVFTLPWYRALSNYAFGVLLLTTLMSVGVYAGLQAMAMLAKIELSRPHIRSHVSLLIGFTLLAYAFQTWLKTFEYGLIDGAQFTGAGLSATYQLTFVRIFVWLLTIIGVGTIVGARFGKAYLAPSYGGIGLVAYYLLIVQGVPLLIQRLSVGLDSIHKEAPYAEKAIEMTRFAYGLDKITVRDWKIEDTPTQAQVDASAETLSNMRLWDPDVLRQALEGLQSFKQFYRFNDVDIDRYKIGGKQTLLMLSPRDLRLDGLPAQAQNWANQRLRYTHGYGVAISQVDRASSDGQPDLLASNMPVQSIPDIPITEPRIYFDDQRDSSFQPTDEFALVDTGQQEFDYPTATSSTNNLWTGDRGVPISGLLSRMAFSMLLGDFNLLISSNIKSNTRLLMRRNILERCAKVYPFLRFDEDPYIVVYKGRLVWILDGYTTTDMIPYSERMESPVSSMNYIRNSVKLTVDAYSGETTAYAVDPAEPILRAYRQIYPHLIRDLGELPKGLDEHFRYPEDLFQIQSQMLLNYHVTDPTVFLSNSDAWDIARERNLTGDKSQIRPYYVQLQLSNETKPQFQLILPFTPLQKPNMSGWLTAQCDPGVYGQMTLYRFSGPLPKGPELMEADFSSTPAISYINRQYNNEQSRVIVGNLLVIPIGKSVMYSESLFLISQTSGIQSVPRLFRVILALNNKVVVGETYADALKQLFQSSPIAQGAAPQEAAATSNKTPISNIGSQQAESVKSALQLFDEANAALKEGDFAKYGQLQKQLRKILSDLAAKS